jgi:23S rRNA (cytidine1920-2'-O)/16S rRNA (cytidine1409-2'-O)-methyltransferase
VLDIGASTGGFTDCSLQAGAADVVCVDVGRAQLHGKLRADPRVTNLEQINARELRADQLPRAEYDAIVIDVSSSPFARFCRPHGHCYVPAACSWRW